VDENRPLEALPPNRQSARARAAGRALDPISKRAEYGFPPNSIREKSHDADRRTPKILFAMHLL
jgi:hypothetical protein